MGKREEGQGMTWQHTHAPARALRGVANLPQHLPPVKHLTCDSTLTSYHVIV